jgi:hypothetical protein
MRRQRLFLLPIACIGIVGLGITGYSLTTQTNAQTQTIAQDTQAPLRTYTSRNGRRNAQSC